MLPKMQAISRFLCHICRIQVYNEQLYDLLSPSSKPLRINEDPSKGVVVVAGLVEVASASICAVVRVLFAGLCASSVC